MSALDPPSTAALLNGRYRLGECVGQGGMARVYRGEDVILGRTVAIKLMHPGLEGLSGSERARSEMTVLASLNHPGLVTLFDAQVVPGQPEYMVMEFVDGPTLGARLATGPLPSTEVAALAADLAEALHVVHSAGVVHRDIKPSNVLLSPSHLPGGRRHAKLADFGIACLLDNTRVTMPGVVIGTVAYLAPEQVTGAEPAPSADIYALGLVLLEALTGTRAFPEAEGIGAAVARVHSAPAIPVSVGPEWAQLLTGMTAMDPQRRPDAAQVAAAASALTTGLRSVPQRQTTPAALPATVPLPVVAPQPVDAAPHHVRPLAEPRVESTASPRRPARRRRAALVGGLAAASLAAVAGIGLWAAGTTATPLPASDAPSVSEPSFAPQEPQPTTGATPAEESPSDATVPLADTPVETTTETVTETTAETATDTGTPPAAEQSSPQPEQAAEQAPPPQQEQPSPGPGTNGNPQKDVEEQQKKLEQEQRKAADEAQRQAEKQQKQADKDASKNGDQ